jgi:hypothetical protein
LSLDKRCDVQRVNVIQQVIETDVGACLVLPGERFRLTLPPRPHADELYVLYKAETFGESTGYVARAYDSPSDGPGAAQLKTLRMPRFFCFHHYQRRQRVAN